ncbi:MAG: 1-acyl-sn-glycerol-3-phosphate acyltransferase [Deltaproteobacteria bacterium]|nr:1-acyl-sn-glycerol-3-phosphate acyltransferase [Deltaproteobacteria bacterium]MBW2016161.1 1-acyl-sn-glycerol-3-phosphate acyltransferase [Deltaproteobacteria bacterium]MBW2130077.1 1-acyl-sn-glycerol-3-phosphate acyltransferase [Deltaproteobacteria bacterium]
MTTAFDEKNVFPSAPDHKPGFLLGRLLFRLFKRVRLDENMVENLKKMHREGAVVYAIKYRGRLDFLLYHFSFRRHRLPYPRIAFDLDISMLLPFTTFVKTILSRLSFALKTGHAPCPYQSGFYRKALEQGTPFLVFLIDPKRFFRHFVHSEKDHLEFLIETQMEMEKPIFLVPQLLLYSRKPEREHSSLTQILFGDKDNPGIVRKVVLFFKNNRRAFIDFGKPLNLKSYLLEQPPERPVPEMAAEIRNLLIERIDAQKRIVLGPIMKSRQQVKETVLTDPRVQSRMESLASIRKKSPSAIRKQAGEYFDEIAADNNSAYIQAFRLALRWLWTKLFDGIEVDPAGLAQVREWARKGNLIYVPSHKSHIDYLILNYVLYDYNLHLPRIAAGRNLAFWPMGHIFRKCGAFFIRRSFKNAKLYLEVFNRYIKALLEEGHSIEFFIEGGRSRNGKLISPKTGFLSILLQAYQEGFCKDLIFVPTSIVYDRVMEEKSYLREIDGKPKEQESFLQMLKARRFLRKKYGKIYIRFADPIALKDYLENKGYSGQDTSRELAYHIVQSINQVTVVTPLCLVATAILANHRRGFHESELVDTVTVLLDFLKKKRFPLSANLSNARKAVHDTLPLLVDWKIVNSLESQERGNDSLYYIEDEKQLELEYYKNSIIHFFISHALVALSLLKGAGEADLETIISDSDFLKELFRQEFIFEKSGDSRKEILTILQDFQDLHLVDPAGSGFRVTKLGVEKLGIWASLAKTFVESYWIVAKTLNDNPGAKRGELLKTISNAARRYYKLRVIEHIGALSSVTFKNAFTVIRQDSSRIASHPQEASEEGSSDPLSVLERRLYTFSHYKSLGG